jgi:hypothetical protein
MDGHESCYRFVPSADHDVLAGFDEPQELGKLRLRLVHTDRRHGLRVVLAPGALDGFVLERRARRDSMVRRAGRRTAKAFSRQTW